MNDADEIGDCTRGVRGFAQDYTCLISPHRETTPRVKYWEIIADNLSKPVGVGAASQPWIRGGKRSSLLTRIAAKNGKRIRAGGKDTLEP